jgi:hypothetical protein
MWWSDAASGPVIGNPFDKAKVIAACKAGIQRCIENREEDKKKELEVFLTYRKYWLFGPELERTPEEAWLCLDSWTALCVESAYMGPQTRMEAVLKVALATTESVVWLTTKEFNDIESWYEKKADESAQR